MMSVNYVRSARVALVARGASRLHMAVTRNRKFQRTKLFTFQVPTDQMFDATHLTHNGI